ncbi:MAG TPA: diguanylate cyclase [Bacillota bacterium]|nr:diguanylate cyclase [Bacillota bacterium]
MERLHDLLQRQLRRYFGDAASIDKKYLEFLNEVNCAYWEFDADRKMLERALELNSQGTHRDDSGTQAVLQAFPDALFWLDRNGTVVHYKAGSVTSLPVSSIALRGKKLQDSPHRQVRERLPEALRQVLEKGSVVSLEHPLVIAGGKFFYDAILAPLPDKQVLLIVRDVTRRIQAETALRESEARLRVILDSVRSGVLVIDAETHRIVDVNRMAVEMIGAPKEELVGSLCHKFICPEDKGRCPVSDLGEEVDHSERVLLKAGGGRMSVMKSVVPVTFGGRKYLLESFVDITERKLMEEQLRYFSLHDALTGVYNRAYFEEEMRRLESGRHNPVGLILCDIDGLKLVNDALGHEAGDELLVEAAGVLKKAVRKDDIVARIGGDEFAVLLPHSDREAVEGVFHRIQDAVAAYNAKGPKRSLSMSVGFATVNMAPAGMDSLFKEADNNMYRDKLHHRQSAISAIVQALMKALEARDFITEGHAARMQTLVADMAEALGLPEHAVADLRLLAQFHDIGKIGIPDNILFKPGPLSPEETREMRQHCEIGYRIAQSAAVLQNIGDWILKHHEWWNGEGYPLGLKGEEIPLECRILAIADAYDAMTSDRPYRKAMSHEKAAAELEKYAGVQFDPQLVSLFLMRLAGRMKKPTV